MAKKYSSNSEYNLLSRTIVEETLDTNPFEKISNIVLKELESAIITSQFSPGQKLSVSQIAEAMNVSPTPVWEAIERLQQLGLVVTEPIRNSRRKTYHVFNMSKAEIEDFFLTRAALESLAAHICASKNWKVDLRLLKTYADEFNNGMVRYSKEYDGHPIDTVKQPLETSRLDHGFHQLIVDSTQNKFLINSYNVLSKTTRYLSIKTAYYIGLELNLDDALTLGAHHMTIYNAISNGYADLARNVMLTHVNFCANRYLRNYNLDPCE